MAGTAGSQSIYGKYDASSGGYTAIAGPQIQSYQVIGTVTAGPPIITDPKTGKPYPQATPEFMENWEWSQNKSADELATAPTSSHSFNGCWLPAVNSLESPYGGFCCEDGL